MSYEKSITDLLELADRIDHEQLWRRAGLGIERVVTYRTAGVEDKRNG